MKLSPDFKKFLSFIPEILPRDESFLKDLESCTRGVAIRKGDYSIRTGELCQDVYFINKGLFIDQYISENRDKCITGFSSSSMYPFVSTIDYFTQVPSEFEVRAIEDDELLCLSQTDIECLSLGYPAFATCCQNVMPMIISKLYSMFAIR